jgi:hypothetical protein
LIAPRWIAAWPDSPPYSDIVNEFQANYAQDDDDDERHSLSINHGQVMTLAEKMERYIPGLDIGATSDPGSFSHDVEESEVHTDEEYEDNLEDHELADTDISEYRDCLIKSSAYEWLRGALSAEINQTPAVPDVRSKIRNQVLCSLRSCRKVKLSRKSPAESYRVLFEVDWDLRLFVKEQGYEGKPEDAIGMAITLTGSTQDCQAMTTSQYLSQTWPSVGSHIMRIIQRVLRGLSDFQSSKL